MKRLLLLGALVLFPVSAFAHTATINWVNPTSRADGSPLPPAQISAVEIYDSGTQIGSCSGACTSFTTPNQLSPGTHSFTVTITDTSTPPDVSAQSAAAVLIVPISAPSVATGVTAVLNADPAIASKPAVAARPASASRSPVLRQQ